MTKANNASETAAALVPQTIPILDPERVDHYRKNAHVLVPQAKIQQINPLYQVRLERVDLSPSPDDRDIYQLPGTYSDPRYGLSAKALYRIARAAGIQLAGSKILSATQDYVLAQARIKKRDFGGEWIFCEGTYELDITVVEEDLYADYVTKMERAQKNPRGKGADYAPKSDDECRAKARTGAMKIRRHKVQRAETGAYCRAIRALLGVGGEFTPDDLRMPFLVPAVHFAPDMSDPEVKAKMIEVGALSMAESFGGAPALAALEAQTGKSRAALAAQREELAALQAGPPVEEDADPYMAAIAGATPADAELVDWESL